MGWSQIFGDKGHLLREDRPYWGRSGLSLSIKSDKNRMAAMIPMADPMIALLNYQKAIESGQAFVPHDLKDHYLELYYELPGGRKRYSHVKIVGGEVQALSIFGLEDPIVDNIVCYNVGYAVSEIHRKRGLAVEAVNKGLDRLKKEFSLTNVEKFHVEAIVEVTNIASIRTARNIFPAPGRPMIDSESGRPALHFLKLINLR